MEFVDSDRQKENIWIAASDGDIFRVKELIEEGVSPNAKDEYGYTPIHACASYNHGELLEYLVSVGGDVHLRDNEGDTPLLVCETPEMFELLINLGADSHVKNNDGQGIAEKAVEDENETLLRFLIQNNYLTQEILAYAQSAVTNMEGINEGEEDDDEEEEDEVVMNEQQ